MTQVTEYLEGLRRFHIGDILSVTSGVLVAPRGMVGVHDLLSYMIGVPDGRLPDTEMPKVANIATPLLRQQHPDLEAIVIPDMRGDEAVDSWVGGIAIKYGETRLVLPLKHGSYQPKNATEAMADAIGANNTYVFKPELG